MRTGRAPASGTARPDGAGAAASGTGPDRLGCRRCRQLQAEATLRWRAAHPPDRGRLYADARERRRQRIDRWRCTECGAERDRTDRLLCGRCRRKAADKTRAHRQRRAGLHFPHGRVA